MGKQGTDICFTFGHRLTVSRTCFPCYEVQKVTYISRPVKLQNMYHFTYSNQSHATKRFHELITVRSSRGTFRSSRSNREYQCYFLLLVIYLFLKYVFSSEFIIPNTKNLCFSFSYLPSIFRGQLRVCSMDQSSLILLCELLARDSF